MELVYNELMRSVTTLDTNDLTRFYNLREHVSRVAAGVLRGALDDCKDAVHLLVSAETAYINTLHPDFTLGTELLERGEHINHDDRGDYYSSASSSSSSSGSTGSGSNAGAPSTAVLKLLPRTAAFLNVAHS